MHVSASARSHRQTFWSGSSMGCVGAGSRKERQPGLAIGQCPGFFKLVTALLSDGFACCF
eukprot:7384303-Prymnesium_polylepis.1